jgi:ribosomal protein S18 acetylase RimI-like enzyme
MKSQAHQIQTTPQEDRAVAALVTAFAADPAVRWMYPDSRQYLDHFPEFVRAFGGRAFDHGTAESVAGDRAAALWLAPDVQPDEEQVGGVLHESVTPDRLPEVFAVLEHMGHFHPEEPHWYLPLIGVDPGLQHQGYGSALLRHALDRCDREGLPAYLESTNERNIPLYERFGFKVLGKIRTETSPMITPMLRRCR